MCKAITGNQKHMTMDDRIMIEKGLDQHQSLRSIALCLGKDPTTIIKLQKTCVRLLYYIFPL